MQCKERTYNQAARTLVGLGLCNAPLAESDIGFSFLWLIVLGTVDALEVPPVNIHTKKRVRMLMLGTTENFMLY